MEIHHDIKKKIDLLQGYFNDLAPYASLSVTELVNNKEKRTIAERYFQLMVDEAIDINASLAYQIGNKVADAYKSTFFELVPLGIINQDFADAISESAKVRNQLTHDYEKLSSKAVAESIKKFFELYQTYVKILVERFIEGEVKN
jgi:uncharacterized protein YutE (UPF0331/DUF86 family)